MLTFIFFGLVASLLMNGEGVTGVDVQLVIFNSCNNSKNATVK